MREVRRTIPAPRLAAGRRCALGALVAVLAGAPFASAALAEAAGAPLGTGAQVAEDAPTDAGAPRERLLDRVYFGSSSAQLSEESLRTLDAIAESLRADPALHLRVEGHSDARGSRRTNLALSRRRAESVRNYLLAAGVAADRIELVSVGADRPLVDGSQPQALAQNRRVDLLARAS